MLVDKVLQALVEQKVLTRVVTRNGYQLVGIITQADPSMVIVERAGSLRILNADAISTYEPLSTFKLQVTEEFEDGV